MADEKAKAGVKVRCSRCRHIFPVQPEAAETKAPRPAAPAPMQSQQETPGASAAVTAPAAAAALPNTPAPVAAGATEASEPSTAPAADSGADELDLGDFGMDDSSDFGTSDSAAADAANEFDFEDFSIDDPRQTEGGDPVKPGQGVDELDQGDFGASFSTRTEDSPEEDALATSENSDALNEFSFDAAAAESGLDFSTPEPELNDSAFAADASAATDPSDFTFDEEIPSGGLDMDDPFAIDEPKAEATADDFSFESDAEEFSFEDAPADAFAGQEAAAGPQEADFSFTEEESAWSAGGGPNDEIDFADEQDGAAADFDFSNMSFGEDSPSPALIETSAPPEVQSDPVLVSPAPPREERPAPSHDEPPTPSAPAAKRSKNPISGILSFVLLLLVLLCAAAGYFYLQGGFPDLAPLIARISGDAPPPAVSGQIRLADLNGFFVNNEEAGQLFVIQGRAINEFSEARSAIAVKGILYNPGGKLLLQQTVFSGNVLDENALHSLPFAKIEESMNNQFGDSLSNLNIAPGKSIPFTIVFRNLPADLAEFTAEVTDSKPGAG